jgi:predicted metal-binding membrane protein
VSRIEALLARDRAIVAGGLVVVTLLAWVYVWRGAGMGMSALEMTRLTLFPHAQPSMPMPGVRWTTVVAMWWIMMIAMMTPSATPLVLLYGRVLRHSSASRPAVAYASSGFLVAGYLLVWLAFSACAAALQYALVDTGLVSAMLLSSQSALLSAGVLVAAGVYQLSPLKNACLKHCRSPAEFLTRHSRPGRSGALLMGLEHGAWCVGCCWMLMALLFVGGVMNLVWIALLTVLVLIEKIARRGVAVGRIAGLLLIIWGAATVIVVAFNGPQGELVLERAAAPVERPDHPREARHVVRPERRVANGRRVLRPRRMALHRGFRRKP